MDEKATMNPDAREYQSSAEGARSNASNRASQAPSITYSTPDGPAPVRFDGADGNVMVDRKLSVTTFPKSEKQALRQSEALRQNGLAGRWEVPSDAEAERARKMFRKLGVDNITVKVVPR